MENQLQESLIQLLSILIGGALTVVTAYVGVFVQKATQKAAYRQIKPQFDLRDRYG